MPHDAPDAFEDHGGDVVARSQRFGDATAMSSAGSRIVCSTRPAESPPAREPSKCDIEPAVDLIVPAVKVADEAHDLRLAGEGAREAQRKMRGLGAGRR